MPSPAVKPWYRERWPWLLMLGPFAAVVAGIVTLVLALRSDDGLVSGDYYKQGLAINQTMARDALAAARGYRAQAWMAPDGARIRLALAGEGALPERLRLTLAHPTRAGFDQVVNLVQIGPGLFEGSVKPLAAARRWHAILEDEQRTWRMTGEWNTASGASPVFDMAAARE